MSEKVEINDTSASENITLEQEAAAIDAKANEQASETSVEESTPEVSSERPEWLPEKFQSAEDMAKAYAELETKQADGEEAETSESSEETITEDAQTFAVNDASTEFEEKGQLSDSTYEKLEEVGLGKEMVDQYIAGQEAMMEIQSNAIFSEIGGKSEYEAMAEWAGETFP